MDWEPVIGLEVHTQLLTRSKAFSGASTQYGATTNTPACAVEIALFRRGAMIAAREIGGALPHIAVLTLVDVELNAE